ncbi:MAG TPA: uroporphyrinogen decarboxylase [Anaerolineae bacterium]|nr:uroporphyrinogen decarboxylase [Anaerolineae bacterium]HIQ04915.1 uroporphyrinogen decarboxylase [Anaerolineae bacterium]
MSKRERLEATFHGQAVDRPAVALWRHWPGDDQRADDLAAAHVAFQQHYDFDFIKVTPSSSFCVEDWGAQTRYLGNNEGTREYTHRPVQGPQDWQGLPVLDPRQGALGRQLRCLTLIGQAVGEEVPFIQTVFNPLSQARYLAGDERLLTHLRRHPAALRAGLEKITQSTVAFVQEVMRTGAAGLFLAVQHARYPLLSEAEYREFGRPYDLRVLEAAEAGWFNLLHLHGNDIMFDLVADYPVQAVNWHDRETPPSLTEGMGRITGAVVGGIRQWETLLRGDPDQVRAEVADAIRQTGGRRLIIGTGCVTPITVPTSNIRAARQAVEEMRSGRVSPPGCAPLR